MLAFDLLDFVQREDKGIRYVSGDILDQSALDAAVQMFSPDAVVHLAAVAAPVYNDAARLYNVNVCGTENVLEAVREYGKSGTRVVLMSTAGVYGNQDEPLDREDMPCAPVNHYSYSKLINEYMSRQYDELDICILRPFTIVGEGQRNAFLVPKLLEAFLSEQQVISLGNLDAKRDCFDVGYTVRVIAEAATRASVPFSILNICSGIGRTVTDIVEILEHITGFHPEIRVDDRYVRKNEIWSMVGDTGQLLTFMNGEKPEPLETTLGRLMGMG